MYCLLYPCFQRIFRLMSKIKFQYVCVLTGLIILLDYFGAFSHVFEITYDSNFVYPYNGDVQQFVHALRHNEKPAIEPINEYNYTYIIENQQKCVDAAYSTFRVVYIVKSAIENFERRSAIRNSWGFEKRFFDVPSRTIFMLGKHLHDGELQAKLKLEAAKYKDIIQADFIDSYYNNTIKTMLSFKWLVKHCSNSKFYMFVDDDMYVSVKNVLRFIRNPANYPDYLKEPKKFEAHKREVKEIYKNEEFSSKNSAPESADTNAKGMIATYQITTKVEQDLHNQTSSVEDVARGNNTKLKSVENEILYAGFLLNRRKRQIFDFELPDDVRLFAGYVFVSSPHRHKSSKWYISLSEYPYHLWPPYVTAGSYIVSKEVLVDMYYTSLYTKHFKFDDIYLGLIAMKAGIEPFHCEEFNFYKKDYTKFNYKYVVTSHGYGDPSELLYVWNEQKAIGNA